MGTDIGVDIDAIYAREPDVGVKATVRRLEGSHPGVTCKDVRPHLQKLKSATARILAERVAAQRVEMARIAQTYEWFEDVEIQCSAIPRPEALESLSYPLEDFVPHDCDSPLAIYGSRASYRRVVQLRYQTWILEELGPLAAGFEDVVTSLMAGRQNDNIVCVGSWVRRKRAVFWYANDGAVVVPISISNWVVSQFSDMRVADLPVFDTCSPVSVSQCPSF